MTCSMNGRPATGSRGLGVCLASSARRVALPPARMIACLTSPPIPNFDASPDMRRELSITKPHLNGLAQHVTDHEVHLLNACSHVGWHNQQRIGLAVQVSAALAGK